MCEGSRKTDLLLTAAYSFILARINLGPHECNWGRTLYSFTPPPPPPKRSTIYSGSDGEILSLPLWEIGWSTWINRPAKCRHFNRRKVTTRYCVRFWFLVWGWKYDLLTSSYHNSSGQFFSILKNWLLLLWEEEVAVVTQQELTLKYDILVSTPNFTFLFQSGPVSKFRTQACCRSWVSAAEHAQKLHVGVTVSVASNVPFVFYVLLVWCCLKHLRVKTSL